MNQPAFPHSLIAGRSEKGMLLRDYFAARALPECIRAGFDVGSSFEKMAADAYAIADEMMKEREK